MRPRTSLRRTRNTLRCVCSRSPILALYGLDENNQVYIHLKVFKGDRVFGEMVVNPAPGSKVDFHCRECRRWLTIKVKSSTDISPLEIGNEPAVIGESSATS